MSTVTITAQIALDRNGYTTTDFALKNVEYMIDDAIDYINLLAQSSIDALSGSEGSKSVDVSRDENAALKLLITGMLREAKKTSLSNSSSTNNNSSTAKSVSVGSINVSESGSVSSAISAASSLNGMDDFSRDLFNKAIERLQAKNATNPAIQDTTSSPFYLGTSTTTVY